MRDDYRSDGYAIFRGAIAAGDLEAVTEDIYGVFARRSRSVGRDVANDTGHQAFSDLLLDLFSSNRDAYLAAAKQAQYLASVHALGVSGPILRLLHDIGIEVPSQSTRPVIHFMADGLRIEGGYHKTPAHQDWRSVQGSLDGVTLWLPLYDVGLNDYPLEIVPGSHRRGLLPSTDDPFGHRIAEGEVDERAFQPIPMSAGDVAVFSGFLVHRTGAKGGRRVRIALSYRFNNAAEPSYVERNYPIPYTYRADMRLLTENFPTAVDLEPYFGSNRPVS
jgi:ectoine hydroxylase-related dioxygenase (phytanoyl-CoA dioxygenase family)